MVEGPDKPHSKPHRDCLIAGVDGHRRLKMVFFVSEQLGEGILLILVKGTTGSKRELQGIAEHSSRNACSGLCRFLIN